MRVSKYVGPRFEAIVREAPSVSEVLRRLGLRPNGGNHRLISARIRSAGIDTSHFSSRRRIEAIAATDLVPIVATSTSLAQVLRALGLPTEGRPHRELAQRVSELGLDTRHFRGHGWARGETRDTHPSVARIRARNTRPDEEVFVEHSPETNGRRLARRLRARGWTSRCAACELADWRGKPLVLHLDHINGVSDDNRLENLRFLCPNCHSQTDTYCGRNRTRSKAR